MPAQQINKVHSVDVDKRKNANTPTTDDHTYTVTPGKLLRLQRFYGGHEMTDSNVRIELIWKIGESETLLCVGYGMWFDYPLIRDVPSGDIVVRMVNGDPGELHMTGMWEGIER